MSDAPEAGGAPAAAFKDHFSGHATDYAAFRPTYPAALFDLLASLPRHRGLALDCATGNGQAATGLAERFARVLAIDASPEQLASARPHPRVEYRVGRAEATGVESGTVDLISIAQAVHWFDFDRFHAEARRLLAPGGAIAVYTYNLARVDTAFDRVLDRLAYEVVGPYWPPERRWVDAEYRDLPFPFAEVATRPLEYEAQWDLSRLLGYIATWSACHRFRQATGNDPVKLLQDELAAAWGDPFQARPVRWPIFMRAGHADRAASAAHRP
ncbi:MAG TPA: class I SAM-dependent methyltransferase [Thermoanaerobaculia bacterium]|nr:class I SAM-dependent methyltransferase [Thermoanaerobaculia bacterium]